MTRLIVCGARETILRYDAILYGISKSKGNECDETIARVSFNYFERFIACHLYIQRAASGRFVYGDELAPMERAGRTGNLRRKEPARRME